MASAAFGQAEATIDAIRRFAYADAPLLAYRSLNSEGRLRRLFLMERSDTAPLDTHESRCHWSLARHLLAWLHGERMHFASGDLAASETSGLADLCVAAFTLERMNATPLSQASVVVASGPQAMGRRSLLVAAAKEQGVDVLEVDSSKLSKDHAQIKKQLKLIARECLLLQRSPLIRNIDALVDEKDQARVDLVGSELVSEIDGPVFVTCGLQRPVMRWDRPTVVIDVKPPTSGQRAKLWLERLGQGTQQDAEFLATQYPLAPALIHTAADAAKTRAAGRKIEPDDIYAGVRAVLDDRLGDFAKRIEVTRLGTTSSSRPSNFSPSSISSRAFGNAARSTSSGALPPK